MHVRPSVLGLSSLVAFLGLTASARANNDLNTSFRAGSIALPSADHQASSDGGVDASQGRANYRIEIVTPPGKSGVMPDLALSYDGTRRESVLGAGWSLTYPSITVRTAGRGGQPIYGVAVTYVGFSGEDLIEAGTLPDIDGDGADEIVHREERDRSFIRYVQRSGGGWRADFPDGRQLTLGTTAAARVTRSGAAYAGWTSRWLPEVLEDPLGNQLTYQWASAQEIDAAAVSPTARYLTSIRYGCQACDNAAFYQEVRLGYGSRAAVGAAPVIDGSAGYLVETELYLTSIITASHASQVADVRTYSFGHAAGGTRLLLTSVTVTTADAALPPITFGYTGSNAPAAVPSSLSSTPPVTFRTGIQALDHDWDGRLDVVDLSSVGAASVYRGVGIGAAEFASAATAAGALPAVLPTVSDVSLEDEDRDLGMDVFDLGGGQLYRHTGASGWGAGVARTLPALAYGGDTVRIDVNRDGHVDLIDTSKSTYWTIHFNNGAGDYTADVVDCISPTGGTEPTPQLAGVLHARDAGVLFEDLNGDGFIDVLYLDAAGNAFHYPGRGRGCWGLFAEDGHGALPYEQLTVTSAAGAPLPGSTTLADLDGDGFADLIELRQPGQLNAWMFHPGVGWSDASPAGPWVQSNTAASGCRVADFDHDGVTEVLCSSGWKLYDFADQLRDLMASVDNGRGLVTTLGYTTSARVAAADAARGAPWTRNLAAPVPVLATIEEDDGRGHVLVRNFGYRDAFYMADPVEDRFELVGFVEVSESRVPLLEVGETRGADPADAGELVRTTYDVGATDWYRRGLVTCREIWPGGSPPPATACGDLAGPLSISIYTNSSTIDPVWGFATVQVDAEDRYVPEGTGESPHLRIERSYDGYGNVIQEVHHGKYLEGDLAYGADEQAVFTDHVLDTTAWNLRLPARIRRGSPTAGGDLDALEITYFRYDDSPVWDTDLAPRGLLTQRSAWLRDPLTGTETDDVRLETITYTAHGMPDLRTNSLGIVTDLDYDAELGLFLEGRTIDPSGLALVTAYDVDSRHGAVTQQVEPDGAATQIGHDGLGRMRWIARPGDSAASPTVSRTYVDVAPLSRWTDVGKDGTVNGLISHTLFDGRGRHICTGRESAGAGFNITSHRDYSARGQLALELQAYSAPTCDAITISVTGDLGSRTRSQPGDDRVVDALGRARSVTHSDGTARGWVYLPLEVQEADEEDSDPTSDHFGTATRRLSDGLDRVITVIEPHHDDDGDGSDIDPGDHQTGYAYDALGRLVEVIDAGDHVIYQAVHDARGRTVQVTDADRGTITTAFDLEDRPLEIEDARGEIITNTYDHAGRIETISSSAGVTTYHYDEHLDPALSAACHTAGRRAWVTDRSGAERYCYDARGNVVREDKRLVALGAGWLTTEHAFDSLDRPLELRHPDATRIQYHYGRHGNVRRLVARSGTASVNLAIVAYDPAGRIATLDLGNGIAVTREYDPRGRLERLTAGDGTTMLQDLTMTIDGVGNVIDISDAVGFDSASFVYDDLYRLISASGARFGGATATYRYDRLGNLTRKTHSDPSSPLDVGTLDYTDPARIHAVTSVAGQPLGYDDAGNLTSDGNLTFTYDGHGMLASVADSAAVTVLSLEYDHTGGRVAKTTASGDSVYYLPAAGAELRRTAGVDRWIKHVSVGGIPIARIEDTFTAATLGDHVFYLAADHLTSPTLVLDATGGVLERAHSHPWGEENTEPLDQAGTLADYLAPGDPTTQLERRFQGREVDGDLGTYDFGARIYRPDLGRFMSPDSVVPDPASGQSWNRYSFVRNNPLRYIDPTGHQEVDTNAPEIGLSPESPHAVSAAEAQAFYDASTAPFVGPPAPTTPSWIPELPDIPLPEISIPRIGNDHVWIEGVSISSSVRAGGNTITVDENGFSKYGGKQAVGGGASVNGSITRDGNADVGVSVGPISAGMNKDGVYAGTGGTRVNCTTGGSCGTSSDGSMPFGPVSVKPAPNGAGGADLTVGGKFDAHKLFGAGVAVTVKLRSNAYRCQRWILETTGVDAIVDPINEALRGW